MTRARRGEVASPAAHRRRSTRQRTEPDAVVVSRSLRSPPTAFFRARWLPPRSRRSPLARFRWVTGEFVVFLDPCAQPRSRLTSDFRLFFSWLFRHLFRAVEFRLLLAQEVDRWMCGVRRLGVSWYLRVRESKEIIEKKM
jgi:hypothetical protein